LSGIHSNIVTDSSLHFVTLRMTMNLNVIKEAEGLFSGAQILF